MASDKVTRRDFIRLSAAAAAGGLMASCATPTAAPATQEAAKEATVAPTATAVQPTPEPTAASSEYTGSPVHGDLVKAGKLPPVEDRIPQNPLIWNEYDVLAFEKEKGRYGGTVVIGNSGGLSGMSLLGLARYMADDTMKFVADIAESWEMTPDAKTVTFHMRKGHKWSDGQPLTAQDWQWYNDEIIHSKYLAAPMGLAGIETLTDKIVAVDDFTLRFETLERDFATLLSKLGNPRTSLPHVNMDAGESSVRYREMYDADTKKRISSLFAVDADLFQYRF